MRDFILEEYRQTLDLFSKIVKDESLFSQVEKVADLCCEAIKLGGKVIFCGNGGSAADSQHLAAEFVSKLSYDRPALSAIALTTDTSALTAIGNDYGYVYAFSRQVDAIAKEGDVLVGISTSGKSKNVIEAIKAAKKVGVVTVGLLGQDGKEIGDLADYQVNIPSDKTPKIQEGHIATGHIICALVEDRFFAKDYKPQ